MNLNEICNYNCRASTDACSAYYEHALILIDTFLYVCIGFFEKFFDLKIRHIIDVENLHLYSVLAIGHDVLIDPIDPQDFLNVVLLHFR